jgi:hypothetical protein
MCLIIAKTGKCSGFRVVGVVETTKNNAGLRVMGTKKVAGILSTAVWCRPAASEGSFRVESLRGLFE